MPRESVHLTEGQFECDIWVNQLHAQALLDIRSMVTLVHTGVTGGVGPIYIRPSKWSIGTLVPVRLAENSKLWFQLLNNPVLS